MTFDISNCRFAFLDVETTGLSPWFGDRICEIAIVLTEGKRIRETYQTLINPQRLLSPGAASVNGLKDADLQNAPLFSELENKIKSLLDDSVIVCHNAPFDLQFLDNEFRRLGHEIVFPNIIDTLLIAKSHYELPSYSLSNVASDFGIQNPEAHRAQGDALTAKNVFFALMEGLRGMKDLNDFIGIYNSPAWPREAFELPTRLAEAVKAQQKIHITYVDREGETTERDITPLQVTGLADYIYLRAHCHLRNDERSFRLDRITEFKA